ncbi:MAG: recombinase family protein [Hyphomicrobiales bacterium]|nr:recombinase family protein [Hyphomicrobiales bacterium]
MAETASFHEQLTFRGVKLYSVNFGEITALMLGFLATMSQQYVEDVKDKTKRGLIGKTRAGLSAGGLGYGYAVDPNLKGGRHIIKEEARIVRRIFEMYANGASPRAIVSQLNGERVRVRADDPGSIPRCAARSTAAPAYSTTRPTSAAWSGTGAAMFAIRARANASRGPIRATNGRRSSSPSCASSTKRSGTASRRASGRSARRWRAMRAGKP